jgi:hypothetical protein
MSATAKAWLVAGAGLAVGLAGAVSLLPWLRQVDPLGLTPVVSVSFLGGAAFGWYVRGPGSPAADPPAGRDLVP